MKTSALKFRGVRSPFSLIELLVVIAVIMILAALIFSTARSARDTARRATCINNQKNIGQYTHDFAAGHSGDLNGILGYLLNRLLSKSSFLLLSLHSLLLRG